MEKDYQRLFKTLKNPTVPTELQGLVLDRINSEIARLSRIRLAIFVPLLLVSSVAVVSSFQYLAQVTTESGFSSYLSIIFSDGSTMLSYWKEFLISLAETAPVFGATIFLGAILAFMGSLKVAIKNAQTTFTPIQLA